MKILILEDDGERIFKFKQKLIGHEAIFTDKPKEAIELLKQNDYDYIMLDHDMGIKFEQPGEDTGYEVALWISQNPDKAPRHILIHSMNNVGAAAMMLVLGRVGIKASYIPCLWEKLRL